jgi:hypothetical protein
MDSGSEKRCLLCGQSVPPHAVKCPACGKGRFETTKRHADERRAPARATAGPARSGRSAAPSATGPAGPAATAPGAKGVLARLLARLGGRR